MGYADRLDYEQHATLDDPRERLEQRMRDEIQCASARQLSDLIGEYDCFDFEMALVCAIKDDPEVPVDHPICHALNALLDALVQRMADRQEKIERDSTPRRSWRY